MTFFFSEEGESEDSERCCVCRGNAEAFFWRLLSVARWTWSKKKKPRAPEKLSVDNGALSVGQPSGPQLAHAEDALVFLSSFFLFLLPVPLTAPPQDRQELLCRTEVPRIHGPIVFYSCFALASFEFEPWQRGQLESLGRDKTDRRLTVSAPRLCTVVSDGNRLRHAYVGRGVFFLLPSSSFRDAPRACCKRPWTTMSQQRQSDSVVVAEKKVVVFADRFRVRPSMQCLRPSWGFVAVILAALIVAEVAVLVPVILTQKQRDEETGASRIASFTDVFGRRVNRLITQGIYAARRTATAGFLGANGTRSYMTQNQFDEFTQRDYAPYLSAATVYIWIPVVLQSERAAFEAFYGTPITRLNSFGNATVPIEVKESYIPFALFNPRSQGEALVGLDITSPAVFAQIGVLIRDGNQTAAYLAQGRALLAGKGPNKWGIFIGAYNVAARAYALGRLEMEGIVNEAVYVPRDQVVVGAWGDFPKLAQLLFKDNSTWLENVTSIAKFKESPNRDRFQTIIVDVHGDKIFFAIAYDSSVYDTYNGTAWLSLAVILSVVCAVVDAGVILLLLMWRHRAALHRKEQARLLETQQMMGYVSHEIRNPLQTIIGMAELELEKEQELDKDAVAWNAVLRSADAIECIANDVLDVRRIQEGRLECHFAQVNVEELFSYLSAAMRPLVREGVVFTTIIDNASKFVTVSSDVRRLRQILINFLTNAAKFTTRGTISLEFLVQKAEVGSFIVRDTGRGIPEDKQRLLFSQFEQVRAEDAHQGFGLGLYLCRMLAKLLNVELGFASTLGVGTVFWLNVPLETPHALWSDFDRSNQQISK